MSVRIGIIGAGANAQGHARYYHESPRARVVAVADPDAARADALAAETGARAVGDYADLLGDDLDAVVVASPNGLHREQAVAAARAGKHVYCEKPMGLTLDESRAIADAVREAGVVSTVGFAVRIGPVVRTMARLLRAGAFGEPVSFCSRRLHAPMGAGTWRADHRLSGGILYEINIHELDWMMDLGGPVASVWARTFTLPATREASGGSDRPSGSDRANDHFWTALTFAGGAVGTHEGSWVSPLPQFYRSVVGTDGGAQTDEWGNTLYVSETGGKRRTVETLDPALDLRANWLDGIEGVAAPVADAANALPVMAVAEAVLASARTGQPVAPAA